MRLPESRFSTSSSRRRGRGLLAVVVIAFGAALITGAVLLVVRMRTPLVPIPETARIEDSLELWNRAEYESVIEVTSAHLAEYPIDGTALALRGFARFYRAVEIVDAETRQELLIGAVRDLRRTLLTEPDTLLPEIHYVLGKAYFTLGTFFYDQAIVELEQALTLGIDQLDLLEYLALSNRELGRYDDSIGYFEAAIERNNEIVHRLALADLLIGIQRNPEGDRLLRRVIDDTDDSTLLQHAYLSLGQSLRGQNRTEEAIESYGQLLEINASSAEAHYGLGETWLILGENERARFYWREAIRLDPNHIESLQRLQEY